MTKRSEAAKRELQRDIEAYLCGEAPSPLAMLRAPRLEGWAPAIRRRGKEFVLVITGVSHGHREIRDGEPIHTSAVAWFDRHERFVRTVSRVYALGTPADDIQNN